MHEYTHYGTGGKTSGNEEGREAGNDFEIDVYGTNLQPDDIKQLMQIINKKLKGELTDSQFYKQVIELVPQEKDESVIPTLPAK